MPEKQTIFERTFDEKKWKPIRHCPGRFILAEGVSRLTAEELTGTRIRTHRFRSKKVPDEILIVRFDTGGGLISYLKEDGRFLHTLNDEDGMNRKLRQLEIDLPESG